MAPSLLIISPVNLGRSRSQPFPMDDETRTGSHHAHGETFIHVASSLLISPSSSLSSPLPGNHQLILLDDIPNGSLQNERIYQIVGGTIGGVVFLAISVLCVLLLLRSHRRKENASKTHVMGPLQVSFPTSKEAFTSPKYSHYGLTFSVTPSPSKESFTSLPQRHHKTQINLDSISTLHPFHA